MAVCSISYLCETMGGLCTGTCRPRRVIQYFRGANERHARDAMREVQRSNDAKIKRSQSKGIGIYTIRGKTKNS